VSDQFGVGIFLWLRHIPANHKDSYDEISHFAIHDAAEKLLQLIELTERSKE